MRNCRRRRETQKYAQKVHDVFSQSGLDLGPRIIDMGLVLLFHLAYLLMQFVIAGMCLGISAFLSKSGIGIGIGVAAVMYFLNIVANISKDAEVLKYVTPFGFCEGADIINDKALNLSYLIPGLCLMAAGIAAAYVKYCGKDINA